MKLLQNVGGELFVMRRRPNRREDLHCDVQHVRGLVGQGGGRARHAEPELLYLDVQVHRIYTQLWTSFHCPRMVIPSMISKPQPTRRQSLAHALRQLHQQQRACPA